jgi:hypothetical protein
MFRVATGGCAHFYVGGQPAGIVPGRKSGLFQEQESRGSPERR